MRTRTVLDTYCCGGGAGWGYHLAGYRVVGVDNEPQPDYPFEFIQDDAISFIERYGRRFDLIHGSPPCQGWSALNAYNHQDYPKLIGRTREAMRAAGVPYVIENVVPARPELEDPVLLCGTMTGRAMYRHRLFEASFGVEVPEHPEHRWLCVRNGYLPTEDRPFMSIHGGKHSRAWQRKAAEVMGTPWLAVAPDAPMARIKTGIRTVCEAIPPDYTELIGRQAP